MKSQAASITASKKRTLNSQATTEHSAISSGAEVPTQPLPLSSGSQIDDEDDFLNENNSGFVPEIPAGEGSSSASSNMAIGTPLLTFNRSPAVVNSGT